MQLRTSVFCDLSALICTVKSNRFFTLASPRKLKIKYTCRLPLVRRFISAVLDKDGATSILKTREASFVNGKLVVTSYLEKYPFPLYILLNDVEALPEVLADALRQWFELLQLQNSG